MDETFEHVVIIGCGLLGTSLGLALRRGGGNLAQRITGVGRRSSPSVNVALQRGAVDRITDDPALAVGGGHIDSQDSGAPPADLVVICTPLRQIPQIFQTLTPVLVSAAIVTDVGSVKGEVMRWAEDILPPAVHFVGSHPMAGSEQSGPEAAREDLFKDAACIVCAADRPGADAAADRVANLWRALQMRVTRCTPAEHDRRVAAISHLPHMLAAALVNAAAEEPGARELAAGGFLDTTRIASGDVTMWTDILLTNRDAVLKALDGFAVQWAALRDAVAAGDEAAIREKLADARRVRGAMLDRRKGSE